MSSGSTSVLQKVQRMITQELQDLEKSYRNNRKNSQVLGIRRQSPVASSRTRWAPPVSRCPSFASVVLSLDLLVAFAFECDFVRSSMACQLEAAVAVFLGCSVALVVRCPNLFLPRCHDKNTGQ